MAAPTGPWTKADDPDVCVGEARACGLCRNCTLPQADPSGALPPRNDAAIRAAEAEIARKH